MKNSLSMIASILLLSSIMVFSSCDKDDDKTYANVLVTHASPDAPGVDLLIDGNKQNSAALTFPNTTCYLDVDSGKSVAVNDAFTFHVNGAIDDMTIVTFTITFTDANGNSWTTDFQITIHAPAFI